MERAYLALPEPPRAHVPADALLTYDKHVYETGERRLRFTHEYAGDGASRTYVFEDPGEHLRFPLRVRWRVERRKQFLWGLQFLAGVSSIGISFSGSAPP